MGVLVCLCMLAAAPLPADDCGDPARARLTTDGGAEVAVMTVRNDARTLFVELETASGWVLQRSWVQILVEGRELRSDETHERVQSCIHDFALEWPAGTEMRVVAGVGLGTERGFATAAEIVGKGTVAPYVVQACAPPIGDEGCTPGYWRNHTSAWAVTGYDTGQSVASVFPASSGYSGIGSAELLETMSFGGGPGVDGAARILLRAGVAALLNAAHPDVAYARPPAEVVAAVDQSLAGGNRDEMLILAAGLDADNNGGCPL
jgi:hypothetical protein